MRNGPNAYHDVLQDLQILMRTCVCRRHILWVFSVEWWVQGVLSENKLLTYDVNMP